MTCKLFLKLAGTAGHTFSFSIRISTVVQRLLIFLVRFGAKIRSKCNLESIGPRLIDHAIPPCMGTWISKPGGTIRGVWHHLASIFQPLATKLHTPPTKSLYFPFPYYIPISKGPKSSVFHILFYSHCCLFLDLTHLLRKEVWTTSRVPWVMVPSQAKNPSLERQAKERQISHTTLETLRV